MNGDRASFRQWVREHHPDLGGDPAAFAEGLAQWRRSAGAPPPAGHGAVRVHRTPRTPFAAAAAAIRRFRARRERARRLH